VSDAESFVASGAAPNEYGRIRTAVGSSERVGAVFDVKSARVFSPPVAAHAWGELLL
jgi:hypothetical protein